MRELFIALLALTAACTAFVALMPRLLARRGVTMRRTRFGVTLVFDSENADGTPVRLLNVNGTFQSVSYVPEGLRFLLACAYHRSMAEVIEGLGRPVRVMVMGGGGYSLPKYLAAYVPAARTEVVEVDPAITAIARESFFLDECLRETGAGDDGRLVLANDDAWAYLRAARGPFDVIVNDAFSGKRPLGPMATSEGARVVREHLAKDGVYLANVRCATSGRRAAPLREAEDAFCREFAHVCYVPEWPDEPEKPGNNTFVASNAPIELPAGAVVVR